jgi:hypothetical protein
MRIIILLLFFFFSGYVSAEKSDTIRSEWSLDSSYRAEWKKFESDFHLWFGKVYCKKYKIKISCAGCSRYMVQFLFKINENGNPEIISTGKAYGCGKDLSVKQLNDITSWLIRQKFSDYFKRRICDYTLNRTLKC